VAVGGTASNSPSVLGSADPRRVKPATVTDSVAVSEPRTVRLHVYAGTQDVGTGTTVDAVAAPVEATEMEASPRGGPSLHIAVVQAEVTWPPLILGTLHARPSRISVDPS